jgi:hypothetical protein
MVVIDPSAAIEISLYRAYAEDFIHSINKR